jgi:hypothetical protein
MEKRAEGDAEEFSDEGTSAENVSLGGLKACVECAGQVFKEGNIGCRACQGIICEDCLGGNSEAEAKVCRGCLKRIKKAEERAKIRVQEVQRENFERMRKVIEFLKKGQEIKNYMKDEGERIREVEEEDWKVRGLREKFKDSCVVLAKKSHEKRAMLERINENQCQLFEKTTAKMRIEAEIEKIKEEKNVINPERQIVDIHSLTFEYQKLIEKLKETELSNYFEMKEMHDALQLLKLQLVRENSEKSLKNPSTHKIPEPFITLSDLSYTAHQLETELSVLSQEIETLAVGLDECRFPSSTKKSRRRSLLRTLHITTH